MIHRLVTSRSIRSFTRCSETLAARCVGSTGASSLSPIQPQLAAPSLTSAIASYTRQKSRHLSSSSHDDFSPQKKHDDLSKEDAVMGMIDSHVKANHVMLYMKGSPNQPQCGFSGTVVGILKNSGADFASVNVLDYPEVREGIKKYSQWPTIPQLYVGGEFVGGCDIIKDMHESGELKELLKAPEGEAEKQ
eukprot:CAMPEP_0181099168 /NCGR_PEP_ID=MMETSP1071-20121207/12517_1 /TAXON_ID=35127 /ORGANISM="Thalassiosira sp., Strain NH16" /LENGTH=190 /DNA_ID=CAMNT_0023181815 /DNA_START=66 /DNA_END=641 /DNA_ORIENTATION=+